MIIPRTLKNTVLRLSDKFPIVTITGPRQSGKSTLLRDAFPNYDYISLEDLELREMATTDPRGFIASFPGHVIIDEAQRVPTLFSYLQTHVDNSNDTGMYLLAGSQNFLLMESVTQSLAGRTAVLRLLPLSGQELDNGGFETADINSRIFTGGYPRIYDKDIAPTDFFPSYITTYVERDLRQLRQVGNLGLFVTFIKLCAGRVGQLLNVSSLANDCGISVSTATKWLSVLETSYICYLLRPDWNNFTKRLTKSPKLYFYDTGLACSLLGITDSRQLETHYLRGGLFENLVINEFLKSYWNAGRDGDLRFWRDSQGHEIDLMVHDGNRIEAVEIKAGTTFSRSFFDNLIYWMRLVENSGIDREVNRRVVYGGERDLTTSDGQLTAYRHLATALNRRGD